MKRITKEGWDITTKPIALNIIQIEVLLQRLCIESITQFDRNRMLHIIEILANRLSYIQYMDELPGK